LDAIRAAKAALRPARLSLSAIAAHHGSLRQLAATRGIRCVSKIILLVLGNGHFGRTNPLTTAASSKVRD